MNKTDTPRKALGKGLGALLPTRAPAVIPVASAVDPRVEVPLEVNTAINIAIDRIDPNPHQPRRMFQSDKLSELAQSIRANGIIQPLVVRRSGDRFQLVAGERRWRAAKIAGIAEVPIVVRDVPDDRLLEITLIENIQREDLNPVETATAFARMSTELSLSPEQIGMRTGKDRSTVVNFIRLLQLPVDIQRLIAERSLTAGHARCLLTLPDVDMQRTVAAKAVEQGWSVRQLESATQKLVDGRKAPASREPGEIPLDPNVKAAIQEMERALGTKVRVIERAKGAGRIEIEYYSQDDLDRIYAVIAGEE